MSESASGPVPTEAANFVAQPPEAQGVQTGTYDHLLDPSDATQQSIEAQSVEAAAFRPEVSTTPDPATEAARQAAISAADRKNREAAGLPPRTHNLT